MAKKIRADQILVERGLADSREQAQRYIMAGLVFEEKRTAKSCFKVQVNKAGQLLAVEADLYVQESERFVSRGAYKLLTALEEFKIDVKDLVVLDAGASTGGFTDCLLQYGAAVVYAVDVGYGQLHPKLRADSRVVVMEKTNLRLADSSLLPEQVDLITADLSFISLKLVLPSCLPFLKPKGKIIALIKPQFELGMGRTEQGVVKKIEDQKEAVDSVLVFCRENLNLEILGVVPSKIKGPKGNQEYLAFLAANSA